jgi:hypothetical protein
VTRGVAWVASASDSRVVGMLNEREFKLIWSRQREQQAKFGFSGFRKKWWAGIAAM